MKNILVVAPNSELADNLRTGLDSSTFRVSLRANPEEAEPLLVHGLADVCIVDVDLRGVQEIWMLERLRKGTVCPLIVCTGAHQPEWEEQAYLKGASHVISKPVRARSLAVILEQLFGRRPMGVQEAGRQLEIFPPVAPANSLLPPAPTLTLLRDFSSILTHSLNVEELLKQLLLLLRQVVAVNRAAIFLRPSAAGGPGMGTTADRELGVVASFGLADEVLERMPLSLDRGLGAQLERVGRILRFSSEEVRAELQTAREFELLGARVAVPMMHRGVLQGVALFDGRVTGEPLTNPELELIFHLLEQAGMAVRNIGLHAQQTANHELLAGVLRELGSACVVVDQKLKVLHFNKMALKCFGQSRSDAIDFADLPAQLGTKIYQVLRTGAALAPFRFEPGKPAGTVFQVTLIPFQRDAAGVPGSVLLTAEDLTQAEQLRRLEIEASDLRMVKSMAHRLVAETGNAIVPLNTFVQIPPDAMDRSLLDSMLPALKDTDRRIERRVKQFRYLAEDALETKDALTLKPLLEHAYVEAQNYHAVRNAQFIQEHVNSGVAFPANRERLTFALAEIMINALQANPANPVVTARRVESAAGSNRPMCAFEIHDNGPGFAREALEKIGRHFFTTRIPGLGLGLAVARKIIESHGGLLEIIPPDPATHGIVRISLPLAVTQETQVH